MVRLLQSPDLQVLLSLGPFSSPSRLSPAPWVVALVLGLPPLLVQVQPKPMSPLDQSPDLQWLLLQQPPLQYPVLVLQMLLLSLLLLCCSNIFSSCCCTTGSCILRYPGEGGHPWALGGTSVPRPPYVLPRGAFVIPGLPQCQPLVSGDIATLLYLQGTLGLLLL